MADRYRDRVSFLAVYIREAHPEDGWVLPENRRSGVAVQDPTTATERRAVAATCAVRLEMRMPVVVDGPDNAVASAYGGWPDRLYLVDRGGRIAYQGGEGPFGFRPAELERAIEALGPSG
jgi:hypothetical protein